MEMNENDNEKGHRSVKIHLKSDGNKTMEMNENDNENRS